MLQKGAKSHNSAKVANFLQKSNFRAKNSRRQRTGVQSYDGGWCVYMRECAVWTDERNVFSAGRRRNLRTWQSPCGLVKGSCRGQSEAGLSFCVRYLPGV